MGRYNFGLNERQEQGATPEMIERDNARETARNERFTDLLLDSNPEINLDHPSSRWDCVKDALKYFKASSVQEWLDMIGEETEYVVPYKCSVCGLEDKRDMLCPNCKIQLEKPVKAKKSDDKIEIVNCTPHQINFKTTGLERVFPTSGNIARVSVIQAESGEVDGMPVFTQEYGELENVPESDGRYYIVSGLVKSATKRKDLIAPDTGKTAIRNEKGHIVAVTQFII